MSVKSDPKTQEKIGKNLKRIREEIGLSQEQVAKAVGISPSYYNKLERGKENFSARLEHLCKVLKVEAAEILPY